MAACTHELKFLTGFTVARPCWGPVVATAASHLFLLKGFAFSP